jgi:hypothetical protein
VSEARLTLQSVGWTITGFHDAALDLLNTDIESEALRAYFYAVTPSGWRQLEAAATRWMGVNNRPLLAFVGTDHALTDPVALDEMLGAGVDVRVMRRYRGIYHPKVLWFVRGLGGKLLAGSNNLTLDGLKRNIEFATLTSFAARDADLMSWHNAIETASDILTPTLLASYRAERDRFERRRLKASLPTFTWRDRTSGPIAPPGPGPVPTLAPAVVGDLIIEITPRETGADGRQVQIPSRSSAFFGLGPGIAATVTVNLRNVSTGEVRALTMTRFGNVTIRLAIHELEPRDRPCVMIFRRVRAAEFDFEIVQESVDPTRYRSLLGLCVNQTRRDSKRWAQVA